MQEICALIMTPLDLEFSAVIKHVSTERETIFEDQAAYVRGRFKGNHHNYSVVVCEPGMRNVDMALATERAIKRFSPSIVLLVGIAGGIKDVKKGDVAIASSAFNYDSGKELENQFLPRPTEFHFSKELLARAKALSRSDDWKKRTSDGAPQANILIAPVASGDKVVAAVNNPTYDRIVQYLSHCKFLEMEAGGFGLAVQPYRDLHALVIRGISDMCAGKAETDLENWQEVAAERAAAVAFELLGGMDGRGFLVQSPTGDPSVKDVNKKDNVLFSSLRKQIASGKIKDVLLQLSQYTETRHPDSYNEIVLLTEKMDRLSKKQRIGTISNSEANIENAQILSGVLDVIDQLESASK